MNTKNHPVTSEAHCGHECACSIFRWDQQEAGLPCIKKGCKNDTRNSPDSLALLEAWRTHIFYDTETTATTLFVLESKLIKRLRENPDAVRDELVKMGVWKE